MILYITIDYDKIPYSGKYWQRFYLAVWQFSGNLPNLKTDNNFFEANLPNFLAIRYCIFALIR